MKIVNADELNKDFLSPSISEQLLFDVFSQACAEYEPEHHKKEFDYDHLGLSIYRSAQEYLINIGMIRPEQCRRK